MAKLTITQDRGELERLEEIIQENIGAFYRVGKALMKIRDEHLYSKVRGIENFETYCRQRWDMSRPRAYQLIDAVTVKDNLSTPVDISEFQIRPLAKLKDNPEAQREAWQRAVETAPEGKVTAAHVQKVVRAYQPKGTEGGEPKVAGEDFPAGDSFVLSELKRFWKRATKAEKVQFLKWVEDRRDLDRLEPRREVPKKGEWYDDGLKFCAMAIAQMERIHKKDVYRADAWEKMYRWLKENEAPIKASKQDPPQIEVTEAMGIATFVICHLERIRQDDPHQDEAFARVRTWLDGRSPQTMMKSEGQEEHEKVVH